MHDDFDPYRKWLGIRTAERPLNHYQLLGLVHFEDDAETISNAAEQRMAFVRTLALSQYADLTQRVLNELASAKVSLLNPDKKVAYDKHLRARDADAAAPPVATPQRPPVSAQRPMVSPPAPVVRLPPPPRIAAPRPAAKPEPLMPDLPPWSGAPAGRRRPPSATRRTRGRNAPMRLWPFAAFGGLLAVIVLVGVISVVTALRKQDVARVVSVAPDRPDSKPPSPEPPNATPGSPVVKQTKEPTPRAQAEKVADKDDEVPDFFETDEEKPATEDFFGPDEPPAPAKSDDPSGMVHTFSIPKGTPGVLAFSPDGRRAASGCDNIVGCWDIGKRTQAWSSDELDPVRSVRFSPDGDRVFACTNKRWVIFNAESGKQLDSFDIGQPLVAAKISNDCRLLGVIYGEDHSGAVYNIEQRQVVHKIATTCWGPVVALSRNNAIFVCGYAQLDRFDLTTGQLTKNHIVQPTNSVIHTADFSPDNEFLATGSQQESFPDIGQSMGDRMVRLWNVGNGQLVREFKGHREFVYAVAFTPDGKRLLSGGGGNTNDWGAFGESCDRSIRLWDVGTGQVLRTFDGHKALVGSLSVSPDGRHFLSGSLDATMILWRLPGSDAETVMATGNVVTVNAKERIIKVLRKTAKGETSSTFTVSPKAEVVVDGTLADLSSLTEGQSVTVTYDTTVKQITKIEASRTDAVKVEQKHPSSQVPTTTEQKSAYQRAAERIIRVGGTLGIEDAKWAVRIISTVAEIPETPLQISRITFDKRGPNDLVTDADLEGLLEFPELRSLVLRRCKKVTDNGLSHVSHLPKLTHLDISDTGITDNGGRLLGGLTSLQSLHAANTRISDETLKSISSLPNIQVLDLTGTLVSDKGIKHLSKLITLTGLDLEGTKITGTGVKQLAPLKQLRYLNLASTAVGDDEMQILNDLTHLTSLLLAGTQITDRTVQQMQHLKLLSLSVWGTKVTGACVGSLSKQQNLMTLWIGDTKITPKGRERLQKALPKCKIW
ncbi:MAG TPA: hypothetical protein VMV69_11005 [Pirellulales bacterium]|nr:hypothetical protein [Pirellulales bacterium]